MTSSIIAFVSIFLGLVSGAQVIEVSVGDQVAEVEILLNGEVIGELERPPWRVIVDLGKGLTPHRLEAVAFDAKGAELARSVQWVNMARSVVQASVVIEREADGSAFARLTWANPLQIELESLAAWMNGKPLRISDPSRIPLPQHDLKQLHFLRAQLEFKDNVSAVAEVTFGGAYSDHVSTELTAVPVIVKPGKKLPDLDTLQHWFLAAGRPARVAAVETGPVEIIMIRDQGAQRALNNLVSKSRGTLERFSGRLKRDQKLAFMWPYMEPNESGINAFPPLYGWLDPQEAGVGTYLALVPSRKVASERQVLADAVAVAAMGTVIRNRRRAVVLVLGKTSADSSLYDPSSVRSYLRDLHVPLFIWSPSKNPPKSWGEVEDISSPPKLRAAVKRLSRLVDQQRIVWIEGRHLPQDITLAPGAAAELAQ
jgi:hypothetical protein